MPETQDFKTLWMQNHPTLMPVGHMIKHAEVGNITRFHTLPKSAESAENFGEIAELLRRYDQLGAEILTRTDPCWMVVPEWSDPTGHPEHLEPVQDTIMHSEDTEDFSALECQTKLWELRPQAICQKYGLKEQWESYYPDHEAVYKIQAGLVHWDVGQFKKVLLNIYRERVRDIFWLNPKTGSIFAPYYAGVDVLTPSRSELLHLVAKFDDFLPTNGHGFAHLDSDGAA